MRLSNAFDRLQDENQYLKLMLVVSGIAVVLALTMAFTFSNRDPLIVERGCHTEVNPLGNAEPSEIEQKEFIRKALAQRFTTEELESSLLSPKQLQFRAKEQDDLSKNKMSQVVFIHDIKFSPNLIQAEVDRLISVGDIRSAFKFPLKVQFEKVPRTRTNPYGLVLTDVNPIAEVQK